MQSNGGTTTFDQAEAPINGGIGPVAGVYSSAILGQIIGKQPGADVGGTTAKCSLIDNGKLRLLPNIELENGQLCGIPNYGSC